MYMNVSITLRLNTKNIENNRNHIILMYIFIAIHILTADS